MQIGDNSISSMVGVFNHKTVYLATKVNGNIIMFAISIKDGAILSISTIILVAVYNAWLSSGIW